MPPVITLNGEAVININVGDVYTDPGATALDDIDGPVAVIESGAVDTATAGTYTITYDATDAAGNHAAEVTRTVNVAAPSSDVPTTGLSPENGSNLLVRIVPIGVLVLVAEGAMVL